MAAMAPPHTKNHASIATPSAADGPNTLKLELRGITKSFGTLVANDDIDLVVETGEIHGLLGENGAGKSTLMNVLYGLYSPSSGEILIDDVPVRFSGPSDAMAAGIGMVHQHFMLVPVFTVAENVALGAESTTLGGILNMEDTRNKVREISTKFGFDVDPDALVEDLPVGVQQRVEIIKALVRNSKILILDEPTAVLTPQETDELMDIMGQLREGGTSIVFISHKLREVKAVSDTITVIRRGKVVGSAPPSASTTELAAMMVGRAVNLTLDKADATPGEVTFEVKNLTVMNDAGHRLLDNVTLSVAKGEILAIAGVQGNGQTELTEAVLGLHRHVQGSITLDGKELLGKSVREVLDSGVGFVPEDRQDDGLVGEFSIAENLVLDLYKQAPYSRRGTLNRAVIAKNAVEKVEEFDVRAQTAQDPADTLSGGNQQKVVLARELSRPLKLFIASQPTRGVDVGSIEFLHKRIVTERDAGTPVVIVSTELDEVLELADRIAVLFAGRLMGIVPGKSSRALIGLMMAGLPAAEAQEQMNKQDTEPGTVTDTAPASGTEGSTTTNDEGVQP